MGKKLKFRIGKVLIFNAYGDDHIKNLFDRVETCEQRIASSSVDMDRNYAGFEQKISGLENELYQISKMVGMCSNKTVVINFTEELQRLQSRIDVLNEKVQNIQKTAGGASAAAGSNKGYEKKFAEYDRYLKKIGVIIQKQNDEISQLKSTISAQERYIRELVDRVNQLEAVSSEYSVLKKPAVKMETSIQETAVAMPVKPVPTGTSQIVKTEKKVEPVRKCTEFALPVLSANQNKCFITEQTTKEKLKAYLNAVSNTAPIVNALQKSFIDEKDKATYRKILSAYVNGLCSDLKKKKIFELDDYEVSEEVTTTIGKAVQDSITSKIMPAVIDRIRRGYTEFSSFLSAINQYLESIGFYTEIIQIGEKITDRENSVHLETIFTPTSDRQLHGKIYEIMTLPYFINYIDEDENNAKFICKGSCLAYRYE